jgi:hypothetical protein
LCAQATTWLENCHVLVLDWVATAHALLALQVPRLYYSTFSKTVWRLYGGAKGLLMMY